VVEEDSGRPVVEGARVFRWLRRARAFRRLRRARVFRWLRRAPWGPSRNHSSRWAARWRYQRNRDGTYTWHGLHHTTYLVTFDGTTTLRGPEPTDQVRWPSQALRPPHDARELNPDGVGAVDEDVGDEGRGAR